MPAGELGTYPGGVKMKTTRSLIRVDLFDPLAGVGSVTGGGLTNNPQRVHTAGSRTGHLQRARDLYRGSALVIWRTSYRLGNVAS